MTRRRRHRLRVLLLGIVCLLFQQVALAAYLCPMEQVPTPAERTDHCAGMAAQQVQDNPALCDKHCAPDHSIASDHTSPTVPALALPPLHFAPVLSQSGSHLVSFAEVPVEPTGPPPRLRYCSLLI